MNVERREGERRRILADGDYRCCDCHRPVDRDRVCICGSVSKMTFPTRRKQDWPYITQITTKGAR